MIHKFPTLGVALPAAAAFAEGNAPDDLAPEGERAASRYRKMVI